jgi:hypothetical protein
MNEEQFQDVLNIQEFDAYGILHSVKLTLSRKEKIFISIFRST